MRTRLHTRTTNPRSRRSLLGGGARLRLERLEDRLVLSGAAPTAVNDLYDAIVDQPLEVGASGILANDTDAEGDALTAGLFSGPANGTLDLQGDGSFSYLPDEGFIGLDSFIYFAGDGTGDSMLAAVTLKVGPINHPPEAVNDAYQVNEDNALTIDDAAGVLANDSDIDGDALTLTLASQPLHGSVTLNADGSFSYVPEANFNGLDGFSYFINDGTADSDVATATIVVAAVNDQPVTVNDEFTTAEDTPLTVAAPGILANDSDVDGDALSAILVNPPQNGTVTLGPDGGLLYTPGANFNGVDGFSYVAGDGSADSEVAGVTINVTSVNDAPAAANDEYAADEDTPLSIDAAGGVLANDSDVDGDALSVAIVNPPASGTLTLNADGSFTYTPNANFNGVDGFSYIASDGSATSETAGVTINVNPVNDAPAAADDAYSVDEDTTLTIDAAAGVLANDSDLDGDALSASVVSGPASGTLALNADGSFSYTPSANFNGTDSFIYAASDGSVTSSATVSITVNPVADAPVAAIDNYSTGEDVPLAVGTELGVLANDVDPEVGTLTAQVVDGPLHGLLALAADGSFSYTPEANYNGGDSFTYKAISSGAETISLANIVVEPLNDHPVAVDDEFTIDTGADPASISPPGCVMANDSDIDGDALTASLVSGPANGTLVLNPDGTFDYVPEEGFTGDDAFRYQLFDGKANSNVATVTLHVEEAAQNAAPQSAADSYSMNSGETLTVDSPGVLGNDTDPDGDSLSALLVTGAGQGSLTLNPDGSFSYTPVTGFIGQDSFTYQASDGQAAGSETTVTIDVAALSALPPTAADDSFTVSAGSILQVDAPGVLANDTDPEGDPLTAAVATGPTHGALTLVPDGGMVYTPEAGFTGSDSFTYQASDGTAVSNEAMVTITVEAAANQRPTAVNDSFTVQAGATLQIAAPGVLVNDTDPEGAMLVANLFSGPLHGTLSLATDGSFSYAPNSGFTGLDSFLYRISDGALFSALAAVTIHVTPSESPEPAPTPEPEPTPTPHPCLALDEGETDTLLDTLVAGKHDHASVDAVFKHGAWMA